MTALLAQSGGGYAVEVVGAGASNHLVPVSLGLFDDADGLVQVTGSGLAAGQKVVVAVNMTDTPPPTPDSNAVAADNGFAIGGARGACARRRRA